MASHGMGGERDGVLLGKCGSNTADWRGAARLFRVLTSIIRGHHRKLCRLLRLLWPLLDDLRASSTCPLSPVMLLRLGATSKRPNRTSWQSTDTTRPTLLTARLVKAASLGWSRARRKCHLRRLLQRRLAPSSLHTLSPSLPLLLPLLLPSNTSAPHLGGAAQHFGDSKFAGLVKADGVCSVRKKGSYVLE